MNKQFYDVIIGGAGPVGLLLASELGLAGVSVLVLERDVEVSTPWTVMPLGLRGINMLSAEIFYRRGMLDQVFISQESRPVDMAGVRAQKFAGHFAGLMLDADKFDLSRWPYKLEGPALTGGRSCLEQTVMLLTNRAEELGVNIIRGQAVSDVSQDEDGVTVTAGGATYRAGYLVGCDGGKSTIRKRCGFDFVGSEAEFTGYTTVCELEDPSKLLPGWQITDTGMYITLDQGQVIVMHFDGAQYDRSVPVTREHFQKVLRYVSGTDVTVKDLRLASTFTDRAMQATTYRKGRVFLAGDSAHIHSPLGGQGLNAGFGDAINLGWKLASVINGENGDELLDTYTAERHPIGAWALDWTRAQVSVLKPTLFGKASLTITRALIDTVDGANYFIGRFWGLWQRYDLGDEHPLVGASVPDFEFEDGSRLGPKMFHGKGLLIDFTNKEDLNDLASELGDKVDYLSAPVNDALGLTALLVRPDGIVAWVAEGQPNISEAKKAASKWFGLQNIHDIQDMKVLSTAKHHSDQVRQHR